MSIDEYNEYIKNYIEKDKTRRAIMLTAPWGTGKSYYITHSLFDYLDKNKLTYATVSLYGLNSVREISKELFLEIKFRKNRKKFERIGAFGRTITTSAICIGKTLLKTLAKVDLDFNLSEPNYNKLYDSVNLENKLIIFEDIERSSVDLLEFMGYVNNLVEQDGVKVLLVANEDEICKSKNKINNEKGRKKDDQSACVVDIDKYLRVKEKTVGDTIKFKAPLEESIKSIFDVFNDKKFKCILGNDEDSICCEIKNEIMENESIDCSNLRSFIYACQKTVDLINKIDFEVDNEFLKCVFMSHIAFALRKKLDDGLFWESEINTDCALGTNKYPLYKFSYDFIVNQYIDIESIKNANKAFCVSRDFRGRQNVLKKHFDIIYNYYLSSEKNIISAVQAILKNLKETDDIPFEEYVKLMNYLIAIKSDLGCFNLIDSCKKCMFEKIEKSKTVTHTQLGSLSGLQLETKKEIQEFIEFKKTINELIEKKNYDVGLFDYSIDNLKTFCSKVEEQRDSFIRDRSFIKKINIDKFANMLSYCSAEQIWDLRMLFHTMYNYGNIKEIFKNDKNRLELLKEKIVEVKDKSKGLDKIQLKQIGYFVENLGDIISRLE